MGFYYLFLVFLTNINSLDQSCEEMNILQKMCDIKQPLIKTFNFLNFIDGLCVELYNFFLYKDTLNLGECKKIKNFQFIAGYTGEVPEYVKSFKQIHVLNFHLNKLKSSCFHIISELYTLRSLNLACNLIEEIPKSILKLVNLNELKLSPSNFTNIPEFILYLKLKKLDLDYINQAPDDRNEKENIDMQIIKVFLKMETLESLKLRFNRISDLEFYNENYDIKKLDFSKSNISKLSNSIIKFKVLEHLDLSNNRFSTVPSILSGMESLKELNLSGNIIISYRNVCFYSLKTLHIPLNYIWKTFSINHTLSPVKDLRIYKGPYFHKIFPEIYYMVDLKSLSLHGKFITSEIGEEIKMFKNLEFLYIDSLQVDSINDSIFELKRLKNLKLNLHDKKNKGFPEELFYNLKKLKNLEHLSLKDVNGKSILNNEIFNLENLQKLELYGFFIKKVAEFNRFRNLKYLILHNIKFRESKKRIKLCLQKYNKIIQYYSCKYDDNSLKDLKNASGA